MVSLAIAVVWTLSVRLIKWGWRKTFEYEKQGLLYMWLKIRLQKTESLDVSKAPFALFVLIGFIITWGLIAPC
jgi:hypothetical protein